MKPALAAFLLLCACAAPMTGAERADMQAALPSYRAMTLNTLKTIDRTALSPGEARAYDQALKDKERAAAKKEAEEAKARKAQAKAWQADIRQIRAAYKKSYALPGVNGSYTAGGNSHWRPGWDFSSGWELKAGGDARREWFRVEGWISYRFDDDPCTPGSYCGSPREHVRWWGYDRAFEGVDNLPFTQGGRYVDSCTETSCQVTEHFEIDIPPARIFEAIQARRSLELGVRTDRQEGFHGATIVLPWNDIIALVLHVYDVRGYYADEVQSDQLLMDALPPKKR